MKGRGINVNHIDNLKEVINSFSLGTTALVESRIKNRFLTYIVINDSFDNIIYSTEKLKYEAKAANFTINNVICCVTLFKIVSSCNEEYYRFDFNFFNEKSLRLLMDLKHQKNIHIIFSNEIGDCREISLKNEMQRFFKEYIKKSSRTKNVWNEDQYKNALEKLNNKYGNLADLWNRMGDIIELRCFTE